MNNQKSVIKKAAGIICQGGLVAFPTETVYGLGANALDKEAVIKIFKAKKRPLDNPLIVHIARIRDLNLLAKNIPEAAMTLSKKFWPGPLTIVLQKKKIVPGEVTAGGNTVAIRIPNNKIALALIKTAGVPIAAPSANLAGRPSPTMAKHVSEDLGSKVDLVLDGGQSKIGLESTVVDLTVKPPQVLRPGGVSHEELKKVLKNVQPYPNLFGKKIKGRVKSPGMKYRHYAPQTPLVLIKEEKMIEDMRDLIKKYKKQGKKIGVLASIETKRFYKEADLVLCPGSRKNLEEVAQNLFKTFREFDSSSHQYIGGGGKKRVDIILSETFPQKGIGATIMHRLKKAATKK